MSMKSFSTEPDQVQINFDVDGEMFFLKPGIAAGQMFEISALQGRMKAASDDPDNHAGKVLMGELKKIFDDESFYRFEKRYNGEYKPIGLRRFNEIVEWLLGEALGKGNTPQ